MVSVDRNTLISQIVSLNPQLKADELRKLSDAQLQAKLSQIIAGDNDDFFLGLQIEHSDSVVMLKNHNKRTYTDKNGNEITEYFDDNNVFERTTKSKDKNGNVTERTVSYQNGKPIHTDLKTNGNTIEKSNLEYKTSEDGTNYVEISTVSADKSETVSFVLVTDKEGNIYNDVLLGRTKNKLDGTTVNVSRNKGNLLEQINKPNGKLVLNIYNGNDFQTYDDNALNKLYQRTDMNGSVREVLYDGKGNTYSTVNAGDSWAIIAQRYNVPETKLRALNKQKGELKPGQRILIPGEFNADSAPLKRTESPEVAKLKAENAERNRLLKIEQKQFEQNFNNIVKTKTIPAVNHLSSNFTLGKKDKISLEDFVKNVLHLDTSKDIGKKVLFRLAQLPQEALNKISYTDFEQKQIGGMFAPKTNDFSKASFDDIANALSVRAGINIKNNQEIIADNLKQKAIQSQKNKLGINEQKFSQDMLANIYDNAANMLEQYYNNHGIFDVGTHMEGYKNILDKLLPDKIFGQDFRGTLHIASDYRKIAQRIRNLHSENPIQFKKEFAQLKKDGIVNTEFNEQNIKEFMNLVQSGNVDMNSDKFKKACQKAFGFKGLENTEDYTKLWSTTGNIGDIAIMLMTLGATSELKVIGKTTQATFNMLEKGATKIVSKSVAQKGAKLGTSMVMGGSSLAGYTLTKETLNNLSNPMRDAKDFETWKQTGIASAESFGFGAFGGLLNETVVAPLVKAIEKPAVKVTQSVTKAFAEQGELSGKEILQTALKGNNVNIDGFLGIFKLSSQEYATLARTATAKTVGFGTEVAGFTVYETALDTVKDIIDPKTGRLPEDMTLENLTEYLSEKFGEQLSNLGTIKTVAKFLMMSKGGKMAQKAMMTQMISASERLSELKFKKSEVNGQEFYEVTYPNGARKIVDSPEQAIALSQIALQMDMITATVEVKADNQAPKGVKPKAENVKPETNLKTKEDFESALDKATTREDFLAIRDEIFKMPNSPERVELFELYTRKQQDWSTRRINGNDPNNFSTTPYKGVKAMYEGEGIFKSEEDLNNYLNNRNDLKDSEKTRLMELYKQDAEIVSIALKETRKDFVGQDIPTFTFKDINSLVNTAKINHSLVKDLINEKVTIFGEKTPRFSRFDIVKLVEISKDNPQLVSKLVSEKVKDSTGNEVPKFNAFEISSILDMYKLNPNIPVKLLATDQNGNYKLTAEQRDNIIRSSSQPYIQSEEFIDSITILNSKGIEIKNFIEINSKEKVDVLNIIAKHLEDVDNAFCQQYMKEERLDKLINIVKTQDDIQLIDKYLNKYKDDKENIFAKKLAFTTLIDIVANASPNNQTALKSILSNMLNTNATSEDIYYLMGVLYKINFSKFNANNYISQIKNTDDIETIFLLTATNDMNLIKTLKQEKYNNFSIFDKLLIAETVSQNNIPLEQVVNRFEYYNNLKTQNGDNVITGSGHLSRNDNLKYILGLPDASRLDVGSHGFTQNSHIISEKSAKSSTAVQELADLVKDGLVGNHVLDYLPKEGKLPPVIAKEIHRFYEAYLNYENFDDVLVPRVKSLNESLEYKSGDVFEVEGDPKIYIKDANDKNIQLDIDKATYCKLFPPIERFSSTQNAIGNCWEVTGFNTLFRDPKERSKVLQCFHQKGDDVVVEFPNSHRQYSLAGMENQADMNYLSEGSLGFKLLEYADGKEIYRERMDMYIYNLTQKINDPYIDSTQRNKLQKELSDFINLSADDKNRIYLDENGDIVDNPDDIFDGSSTYARDGGLSFEVFRRLGYKNAGTEDFIGNNLDNVLTNPDSFKKYIMSVDIGGSGLEEEIDIAKGLYSNHAYMLTPNIGPDGKIKDYNLLNPWGIVETRLTLDEIKKHCEMLEYAER